MLSFIPNRTCHQFRFKEEQVDQVAMPDCLFQCDHRLVSSLQTLSKNFVGQLNPSMERPSRLMRAVTKAGLLQVSTSDSTVWPCLGLKKLGDTA